MGKNISMSEVDIEGLGQKVKLKIFKKRHKKH
jgi:hypothetical protein